MGTINLFHSAGMYYFKYYFDDRDLFEKLQEYYEELEYRFEVSEGELEDVIKKLEDYGYNVNIVEEDEIPEYVVIIDKYSKHSDLLRNAVGVIESGDEKVLVMKDQVAKEEALDRGREPSDEWRARL